MVKTGIQIDYEIMGKKISSEKVKKRKERWFNGPRKIKES